MNRMKKDSWIFALDGLGGILTAVQTQEAFQIISLIFTIIATMVSIVFTIWKWWKSAKADGKITPEEVNDLIIKIDDIRGKKNERTDRKD